ncbi:MAG: hypothetical protein Nk1A_0790 [Endomicrobiia bacterium]|nr:MAG: hypothetical protein Nk1A_0790 [Endomicrobiia bacterium]
METQLESMISMSKLGRYEMVRLTLEHIKIMIQSEECRKLTQVELINKALNDVITNITII